MNDADLLKRFVADSDENAFSRIVEQHSSMVYSACLRDLYGDREAAEECTQAVFIVLAEKAGSIRNPGALAGWLFNVAINTVRNYHKAEIRRRKVVADMQKTAERTREEEAYWKKAAPHLNEAVASLNQKTRQAVVLHYLEGKNQEETAHILGCTREAVAKRVEYGKKKIRNFLGAKGFPVSVLTLAAFLADASLEAAPAHLISSCVSIGISTASGTLAAGSASGLLAQGVLKMMFIAKIKAVSGIAAAVLLTGGLLVSGIVSVSGDDSPKQGTGTIGMGKPPVSVKKGNPSRIKEKRGIAVMNPEPGAPAESQASLLGLKIRLEKNPWETAEYKEKTRTLRQIHVAMVIFANTNGGYLPSKMEDLSPRTLDWNAWAQLSQKDAEGMSVNDLKAKAVFKIHDDVKGKLLKDIKQGQIMAMEIPKPGMQWITITAYEENPLMMKPGERKDKGPDFHEVRMYPSFEKADILLHMDNTGSEKLTFDVNDDAVRDVYLDIRRGDGKQVQLIPGSAIVIMGGFTALPQAVIEPGKTFTRKLDIWSLYSKPENLSGCTIQATAMFRKAELTNKQGKIRKTVYSLSHKGIAEMSITQPENVAEPKILKEDLRSNKLTL